MQINELPNWSYIAVPTIRRTALYCFSIGNVARVLDDVGNCHSLPNNTECVVLTGKLYQMMVGMDRYEDYEDSQKELSETEAA